MVQNNLKKKGQEKVDDIASDVGESVEGWGTWAKRSPGPEFQGGHSQSKIRRNFRPGRETEPRESPHTMTPNDLPPCTFKEDIIRMSEAFRLNAWDSVFEASTEPMELEQGEEFILLKVSKGKRKCWGGLATILDQESGRENVSCWNDGGTDVRTLGGR